MQSEWIANAIRPENFGKSKFLEHPDFASAIGCERLQLWGIW